MNFAKTGIKERKILEVIVYVIEKRYERSRFVNPIRSFVKIKSKWSSIINFLETTVKLEFRIIKEKISFLIPVQ